MTSHTVPGSAAALMKAWPDAVVEIGEEAVDSLGSLLDSLSSGGDLRLLVMGESESGWRVAVCMADRLGILSLASGLFTTFGLDVVRADTYSIVVPSESRQHTSAIPRPARSNVANRRRRGRRRRLPPVGPAGRAAMVFEVESRGPEAPDWSQFETELRRLSEMASGGRMASARESIVEGFANAMRERGAPVGHRMLVAISTTVTRSGEHTLLTINAADTAGFLFAFTNALASINVNVVRSEVRTTDGRAVDTFWLTDPSGGRIESERRLDEIRAAATLIKQFTQLLPIAPDPAQALRQFNALTAQLLARADWTSELHNLEEPGVLETLAEMMGVSRFLWEDFLRMQHDNLFPVLLDPAALDSGGSEETLATAVGRELAVCDSHEERVRRLNDFKDREMFRSDLRYITGRSDLRGFGTELSDLADAVVTHAFELSVESVSGRFGVPRLENGDECGWAILGLGKFGGRDMGFGSDIELLIVYEAECATDGSEQVRASTFFDAAVREFLRIVQSRQQGIFEIDMRLRPYGSKGALASSMAALDAYYSPGGDARPFERLALVRTRPVAGDRDLIDAMMELQEAFVYSSAALDLENIQHLRRRQTAELVGRGALNAKLSHGGVVDIEYFVQAWQIVCGKVDRSVRSANTLDAVDALRRGGYFSDELAERIRDSYTFLRRLIEALRVVRGNAKDLDVPSADSREFRYLAHRLSFDSPEELSHTIERSMAMSRSVWEEFPPVG